MKITSATLLAALTAAALAGCAAPGPARLSPMASAMQRSADSMMSRPFDSVMQRARMSVQFRNNPDTDAWLDQRHKIALTTGDRVFDKEFGRVFDSVVVAVSSLELKVDNMERQSGYIASSGIALPPAQAQALRRQALHDWCTQNGFDPALLDPPSRPAQTKTAGDPLDFSSMMTRYEKMQKGLNFQLLNLGPNQTKVKLRFSEVYYPAEVEAFYKLIWQAVDKQIYIDQNLEGTVEKRE